MDDHNLERLIDYCNRHDHLKRIDRSEVMSYYHNIKVTEPMNAFSKTIMYIDYKLIAISHLKAEGEK